MNKSTSECRFRQVYLVGLFTDDSLEAVCEVALKWLEKSTEQEKRNFLPSHSLSGSR